MGKYQVLKNSRGFYFILKAPNGLVITKSQVYASLAGCMSGIICSQKYGQTTEIEELKDED